MTGLTVTTRTVGHQHVLRIHGALDVATAPMLRQVWERLTYKPDQELVLDLAGLEFCDSSGISAFIAARNHAESFGAAFALARLPRQVARMLAIIGLSDYFTVHDPS